MRVEAETEDHFKIPLKLSVIIPGIIAGAFTSLIAALIFFVSPLARAVPELGVRMTRMETKMGGVEGAVQSHAETMTRLGGVEGDMKGIRADLRRVDEKQDLILRLLKK